MEGRCKTCKWWDKDSRIQDLKYDIYNFEHGITKYNPPRDKGYCLQPNEQICEVELHEYGSASLATAPDFGCVLWEKKDDVS